SAAQDGDGAGGRLVSEFDGFGVDGAGGLQIAVQVHHARTRGRRDRLYGVRTGGKPEGLVILHGPELPVHTGAARPRYAHAAFGIDHRFRSHILHARDGGGGRGQQLEIRWEQRILEIERHAGETGGRAVQQLEQLGAGLLFGGVNVLVAIYDIHVDGELVGMRGQGAIALGDGGITFGAKVPDGGRVLDEEGEGARVQQRKHTFG